jgi:hypothetical protein
VTLLGLIVEDQSDAEVVSELVRKVAARRFGIRHYVGHGCGRIHAKCSAWARILKMQGCSLLVIVADLDSRNLRDYSASLRQALAPSPIEPYTIVIPVREIESWLLADHDAITEALNLKKPVRKQANPEALLDPKKHFARLVSERSQKRVIYLNTVHNKKVAQKARISMLRRCRSFKLFEQFVQSNLG